MRSRLLLLCSLCVLLGCADVRIPVPAGPDAIAAPYTPGYQAAAPAMRISLFGGDLEQFQASYPNGPTVAIAGLKTSTAFGLVTSTIGDAVRWAGIGAIAKSYFADKSVAAKQAGITSRTKLTTEAATRQAEINVLKPATPLLTE